MLYGIIVILSLAVLFVVLVRRLPDLKQDGTKPLNEVLVNPAIEEKAKVKFDVVLKDRLKKIKLPKFSLPKIKLPQIKSPQKTKQPETPSSSQEEDADRFFKRGDMRSAEEIYLKIASEQPHNVRVYNRLGGIYLEQRNFADSRDAFLMSVKLDGGVASRHYNLALAYIGLGENGKATSSLEKALELDPNNGKYRQTLEKINT